MDFISKTAYEAGIRHSRVETCNYWFDYIMCPSFYQSIKHALDTQFEISECFALYERIEFEPTSNNYQTDFESDDIQAVIST